MKPPGGFGDSVRERDFVLCPAAAKVFQREDAAREFVFAEDGRDAFFLRIGNPFGISRLGVR